MVFNANIISAIAYTLVTIIMFSLSYGIYYQSLEASCDKCLFSLEREGAVEQLSYKLGDIHPKDMFLDFTQNGCELFIKLQ